MLLCRDVAMTAVGIALDAEFDAGLSGSASAAALAERLGQGRRPRIGCRRQGSSARPASR